jgi:hypothetical protein
LIKGGKYMPETKKEKPTSTPQVQEAPETTIKRLEEQLMQVYTALENASQENKVLRATVKALSNLL